MTGIRVLVHQAQVFEILTTLEEAETVNRPLSAIVTQFLALEAVVTGNLLQSTMTKILLTLEALVSESLIFEAVILQAPTL